MTVYQRRTRIDASLERVWRFHDTVEGLLALTPGWFDLRVEAVHGPDGDPDPAVLGTGSEIVLSMRPFGIGPRQRWTSRIVERAREEGEAWFRDEMVDGPFPRWVHTHRFRAEGDHTAMTDRVEYRLPAVPGPLSFVAEPFFEVMFAYRHRTLKRRFTENEP